MENGVGEISDRHIGNVYGWLLGIWRNLEHRHLIAIRVRLAGGINPLQMTNKIEPFHNIAVRRFVFRERYCLCMDRARQNGRT